MASHQDERPGEGLPFNGSWDAFFDAARALDDKHHILIAVHATHDMCFRSCVVRDKVMVEYMRLKANQLFDQMLEGMPD